MKRITVSLPDELVERIKRAAGGERQVSSYVATALEDSQERENLDDLLAAWRAETPVPEEVRRQVEAELDQAGLTVSPGRAAGWPGERSCDDRAHARPRRALALDQPAKAVAMQARLEAARRRGGTICIPAEVVAQAWRSSRQARLARLLKSPDVDIAVMTLSVARSVGLMCAATNHDDVRPSAPVPAAFPPGTGDRRSAHGCPAHAPSRSDSHVQHSF